MAQVPLANFNCLSTAYSGLPLSKDWPRKDTTNANTETMMSQAEDVS